MTTDNEAIGRSNGLVDELTRIYAESLSQIPHEFLDEEEKQLLLDHGYAVQDMLPGLEDVR